MSESFSVNGQCYMHEHYYTDIKKPFCSYSVGNQWSFFVLGVHRIEQNYLYPGLCILNLIPHSGFYFKILNSTLNHYRLAANNCDKLYYYVPWLKSLVTLRDTRSSGSWMRNKYFVMLLNLSSISLGGGEFSAPLVIGHFNNFRTSS